MEINNDVNNLLAQMRALTAQAQGIPAAPAKTEEKGSFSSLLTTSLNQVNGLQKDAGQKAESFERGDPNVAIGEVMLAMQKANLSFQAVTQVRNRLISAYQDVMNMPI